MTLPRFEPKLTPGSAIRGLIVAALLVWVTTGMLANLQVTQRPWFEFAWRLTMALTRIGISLASMFNVAKIPWPTGLLIFAVDAGLLLSRRAIECRRQRRLPAHAIGGTRRYAQQPHRDLGI
jgi:hypothetical protein